jgi:hypothetical protein
MRDSDVRQAVLTHLAHCHRGDDETRIVQEMGVWSGSVRVDIAVINGELTGIELKSEKDTLERLPFQSEIYSRVFDRVELVVAERHRAKAEAQIPWWWKLTIASEKKRRITLDTVREGQRNPSQDAFLVAHLLWKDEALAVLDKFGLAKGWRGKKVKLIHQRLATELPQDRLFECVREKLKLRPNWLGQIPTSELDVPIHTNLNPSFEIAGGVIPSGDVVDLRVSPGIIQRPASSITHNVLSVPEQLLVHIDATKTSGSDAAANQEITRQRIAYVDWETPSDTLGRCIRGYRRVVAIMKNVWQARG